MIENIFFLCVLVFIYFLAWCEDRQDEEETEKRRDQEFDDFIENHLKPRPRVLWDNLNRCERTENEIAREQQADEEAAKRMQKEHRTRRRFQHELNVIADFERLLKPDEEELEDALMFSQCAVEYAYHEFEYNCEFQD